MIGIDWIIFFVGASNLLISWLVWRSNPKEKLNIYFFIFGFIASIQILFDSLFRIYPIMFVLQCSYAFASLIPITASLWIFEICDLKINKWLRKLFLLPGIFFFILTYINGSIVEEIKGLSILGYKGILGPFFPAYTFYFVIYVALFILLLYTVQKKADNTKKVQIRFVLIGIFLYSFFATLFSLILPIIFNIYDFTLLDAPSFIFFVGFTGYAITKHHLFDVKVIITELLIFTIWLILLIKTFLSNSFYEFSFNGIIFILVVFFGMLLVRSVLRELKQKEQIEEYAKKIEQAYELEKKSNEQLESLDKAKDQFLLAIQHHLRTPLTAMMGYADLLINGAYGKQSKKTTEVIIRMQISTKNLIKMVNDFLDVTQFQLGKEIISLKPNIDVLEIINEILVELKYESDKKEIYLKLKKSDTNLPKITADREKLKAAIYNIIDNAVKYTSKGGVSVSIQQDDSNLKIIISDTGIGISKENSRNMFGKTFERGETAQKTFINGRGIGLFITNQIIKSHKGKIWAESEGEGKGSVFHIELPIEK